MNCISVAPDWRRATTHVRLSPLRVLSPILSAAELGCTAPETWSAGLGLSNSSTSARSDFQVQVNGLRIELGEIDAVLARHESVDFVVTLAGGTVYSYVKIKPGHDLDEEALIAHASRFLARSHGAVPADTAG